MVRKTTILFACLVLAITLGGTVGCASTSEAAGSGGAGSVHGFPFIKIGARLVIGEENPRRVWVEEDLGHGWIKCKDSSGNLVLVNLNATSTFLVFK